MNTSTATATIAELDAKLNSGEINQQEYDRRLRNIGKRLARKRGISKTFAFFIMLVSASGGFMSGWSSREAYVSGNRSAAVASGSSYCSSDQGIAELTNGFDHSQYAKDNNLEMVKITDILEAGHSPDRKILNCEGTIWLNNTDKIRLRYQFDSDAKTVLFSAVQ